MGGRESVMSMPLLHATIWPCLHPPHFHQFFTCLAVLVCTQSNSNLRYVLPLLPVQPQQLHIFYGSSCPWLDFNVVHNMLLHNQKFILLPVNTFKSPPGLSLHRNHLPGPLGFLSTFNLHAMVGRPMPSSYSTATAPTPTNQLVVRENKMVHACGGRT